MERTNFISNIMREDIASGKHTNIVTRFPPEPNGYLHIGHAKSICVNFGLGAEFDGVTYMRFDDTNPEKEEQEYVDSIQRDVKWLGFDWGDKLSFASNYFDQFYEYALTLIRDGRAYVDELSPEEMREYRGSLTSPGKNSPYRERPAAESEKLFTEMAQGVHPDGSMILRLKVRVCAILARFWRNSGAIRRNSLTAVPSHTCSRSSLAAPPCSRWRRWARSPPASGCARCASPSSSRWGSR